MFGWALPAVVFWVVVLLGREELGWRGGAIAVGIWLFLFIGSMVAGIWGSIFISAQALLDVALILIIFRRDFPFMGS